MAEYFGKNFVFKDRPLVIVSANANCMKKSIIFRKALEKTGAIRPSTPDLALGLQEIACFIHSETSESEFLGDVDGCDVIIIDELVETASKLSELCHKLKKCGASRIFLCASHGLFTKESKSLIDLSPVEKVIVSDTVPLNPNYPSSDKIVQIPMAPLIAKVIDTDYFGSTSKEESEEQLDVE